MREGHSDSSIQGLIDSLYKRIDELSRDKARMDWIDANKVTNLLCTRMSVYFSQSVAHDSIRMAVDREMENDKSPYRISLVHPKTPSSSAETAPGAIASPETGIGSGKPEGKA